MLAAYAEDKCAPMVMAACEAGADGSSEDQLASAGEVTRVGRRRTLVKQLIHLGHSDAGMKRQYNNAQVCAT